ncbi:MAG: DUF4358 domain-containing protein [Lachnospiraceae bacterium]|nr:DUF4358 domain-containing protein [Lachnospiraceae bacterium]
MNLKKVRGIVLIAALALVFTGGCKDKTSGGESGTNEASKETEVKTEEKDSAEEKSQAVEAAASAIAGDLKDKISYKDDISSVDLDTAKMFISFDGIGIQEAEIYESSGATAEEIIVLKCDSIEDAKKAGDALKKRVEEQIESYTDYVPEELVKLNEALVVVKDSYAILSVSDDPKGAEAIIKEHLGS